MEARRPPRHTLGVVLAASASAWFGACSWAYDWGATQCSVSADCAALGEGFEGATCVDGGCEPPTAGAGGAPLPAAWSCVAEADGGAGGGPSAGGQERVTIKGHVKSHEALALAGVSVRACVVLDVDCGAPADGPVLSNEAGDFELSVPSSFSGYLEMSAPGYVPSLFSPVVAGAGGDLGQLDLLDLELGTQIFEYIGISVGRTGHLAAYGAVYARAYDCAGAKSAGVRFALAAPGESALAYLDNDAIDFGKTQTSANGGAIFTYITPGVNAVVATLADGGAEVDRLGVVLRPGALTTAIMKPGHFSF